MGTLNIGCLQKSSPWFFSAWCLYANLSQLLPMLISPVFIVIYLHGILNHINISLLAFLLKTDYSRKVRSISIQTIFYSALITAPSFINWPIFFLLFLFSLRYFFVPVVMLSNIHLCFLFFELNSEKVLPENLFSSVSLHLFFFRVRNYFLWHPDNFSGGLVCMRIP